jgi:hypothetical protein
MNPNEFQPQQQPGVPPQPQQPNVQVGGQPQVMQPQVGPYGPQPTQSVYSQPQPMYGQNSSPSSGSKGKMLAIIGGVVVLIVVVVLAIVLLGHKSNKSAGSKSGGFSNSSGSGFSASAATTSKSACELFSLTNAQAAIGSDAIQSPYTAPQTKNNNTQTVCLYGSNSNSLTIIVDVAQNSAGSSSQESNFNKTLSLSGTVPVSGLGDKALYGTIGGGKYMSVIKGNVEINLTVDNGSQATLTSMAQTMISNF